MCDTEDIRSRSESVCSSDIDDIELFPLTDVDLNNTTNLSVSRFCTYPAVAPTYDYWSFLSTTQNTHLLVIG